MGLFLINGHCPKFMYEPEGFNWFNFFKEELKVNQPLNGDKIKRYIENECRNNIILFCLMINQFNLNLYLKLIDLMII